ncbi:MAG: RNA polymerase subunit sigma [Bacteroidetes bacterium HGW-Bacteroidetes-2]|nr:MAG: RNA polymerase subunit sigma [Bacteroidetes bacterium HGW-Bacteroidetes-2]
MALTNHHINPLIELCKNGNQLAQLEVYNRYFLAMYNTAFLIVKNQQEAEDIMQESFLSAFTKLHQFQGDASFGAWLKRIVINKSISKYRKQIVQADVDLEKLSLEEVENPPYSEISYSEIKAKEVVYCLNQLKDNYRLILTLHYLEGYDYEEISEIMKMSYANCRTMLSRAKENLRKEFEKQKVEQNNV